MEESAVEREIKLLGEYSQLQSIFYRVSVPRREYIFDTVYRDDAEKTFSSHGFSLRFRPKQNFFLPCVELKHILGEQDGVSTRTEITVRGDNSVRGLYFNLLASPQYPQDLPRPKFDSLKDLYTTSVHRAEGDIHLGEDVLIEAALDRIRYMKDGRVVGVEDELEFEVKQGNLSNSQFMDFIKASVVMENDVNFTTESKAYRLQRLLQNIP